ncbi:MAG TPA: ATP-binding protein [Gallionella sp.]|nr:ATP-binding protein [Gallionella sp.]
METNPVFSLRRFWFASIRRQITLSFAAVSTVVMLLFGYGILMQERDLLRHESADHALTLAHTVAVSSTSWVAANDVAGLQEVLSSIGRSRSLRFALVLSPDGRVLASVQPENIGLFASDEMSLKLVRATSLAPLVLADNETMIDVAEPVMAGARLIGWVRIGIARDEMAASLRNVELSLYLMLAVAIVATALVALALSGGLTRRLQHLVSVTNRIHGGQRAVRADVAGTDEVSVLAERFNNMLDTLQASEHDMLRLNLSLQDAEKRWRFALEGAGDGVWDWDMVDGKTMFSKRWKEMLGYRENEFADTYAAWEASLHPDDKMQVISALKDYFDGKLPEFMAEFRMRCKDGEWKWIQARGIVVSRDAENKPLRMISTHTDITGRKQAEEALQRSNADLERFAYSVSHDMRQPLRAVSGHLQLLQRSMKDKLDEDERDNMNFALEGARRMDSMIVSLLEYSRVGRKTESKQWLASRESLDEALGFLAPLIGETGADVKLAGEWPQVFASRDELTRLFQNLIGNAIKFREPDQPPQVEIASSVHDGKWQVSVKDHGVGIAPHQIDRLFQFFSRLQSRMRFDGTGMGLALCRRIVDHHNGRIWVESEGEGKGSTFVFELALPPMASDRK